MNHIPYFVYILECADGTYYTGITTDVAKRIQAHNQAPTGAKYTRGRGPVKLVFQEQFATRSEALKREYEIKTWTRTKKSDFINNPTPPVIARTPTSRGTKQSPELKSSIPFTPIIRVNPRARRMRLTVYPDRRVVITVARPTSERSILQFVKEKHTWIQKQLAFFDTVQPAVPVDEKKSYKAYKDSALRLCTRRVEHFNKYYNFAYTSIRITNTKSQWGSCSASGVLSFNYRIAFIAPSLADYLIVHELCHLREFNHSTRFWRLVEETIPNYKVIRAELKQEGFALY